MVMIEILEALVPAEAAHAVVVLALLHQDVVSLEVIHRIDDVPVAQHPLIGQHGGGVALVEGIDVRADDAAAVAVENLAQGLRLDAEANAVVGVRVVIADLDIAVAHPGNLGDDAQRVLLHRLTDGIQNQANTQRGDRSLSVD